MDSVKAFKYFEKASEMKIPNATFYLGICYLEGSGVAKNTTMGMRYISSAANQGCIDAKTYMDEYEQYEKEMDAWNNNGGIMVTDLDAEEAEKRSKEEQERRVNMQTVVRTDY